MKIAAFTILKEIKLIRHRKDDIIKKYFIYRLFYWRKVNE